MDKYYVAYNGDIIILHYINSNILRHITVYNNKIELDFPKNIMFNDRCVEYYKINNKFIWIEHDSQNNITILYDENIYK